MKKIIVNGKAGSGKALCNSTLIPCPKGTIRVGDVRVGDYLFSRTGKPTKVLGVYAQGKRDVYKITFSDGREALCSKDHRWSVYKETNNNNKQFIPMSVEQILNSGGGKKGLPYRYLIQTNGPVEYEKANFYFTPYSVGVFLGKGLSTQSLLQSQEFSLLLAQSLIDIYQYGSIEQRENLIQGLLKGNDNGKHTLVLIDYDLTKRIQSIFQSLGISSLISAAKQELSYYTLEIEEPNTPPSFIEILNIEKLDYQEEMTCFYVDNDEHLFLMNNFIVTHNTTFEHMVQEEFEKENKIISICSTIDYVKEVAKGFGWTGEKTPKNRKMLSDLKDLLTNWNDVPYQQIKTIIEDKEKNGDEAIFIDCREPEEIERFVKDYGAATLLVQRYGEDHLLGNHADDDVMNYNYDVVIDNKGSLEDLQQKAVEFTKELF